MERQVQRSKTNDNLVASRNKRGQGMVEHRLERDKVKMKQERNAGIKW